MANASVTESAPRELFSFNGTYVIHDDTSANDLLNDAVCWIDSAMEIVNEMAAGLTDKGSDIHASPRSAGMVLWGAYHLLQMVDGAVRQAHLAIAPNKLERTSSKPD